MLFTSFMRVPKLNDTLGLTSTAGTWFLKFSL